MTRRRFTLRARHAPHGGAFRFDRPYDRRGRHIEHARLAGAGNVRSTQWDGGSAESARCDGGASERHICNETHGRERFLAERSVHQVHARRIGYNGFKGLALRAIIDRRLPDVFDLRHRNGRKQNAPTHH